MLGRNNMLPFDEWLVKYKRLTLDDYSKMPADKQKTLRLEYGNYEYICNLEI